MKLRIGMAGIGLIGRHHFLPGIRNSAEAELVGVCSGHAERAREFAREMGIPRWYESYEAMLADNELDAVVVGSPNYLHHPQVLAAAAAGKHVLCEKPMAINLREAQDMVRVCRQANVTLLIGHHLRFKACNRAARQLIEQGELGDITTARVQWSFALPDSPPDTDWHTRRNLSGGGQIMNVGSHALDLLVYCFGRARRVSALVRYGPNCEVEDTSLVMVEFENGVLAMAEGSYREADTENSLEIFGRRGSVIVTGACSVDRHGGLRKLPGTSVIPVEEAVSPYTAEVDHLVRVVRKECPPVADGQAILETMHVVMAAYQSAQTGRHVDLINERNS